LGGTLMGFTVPINLTSIDAYINEKHHGYRHLELSELQVLDAYVSDILNQIEDAWPVDTSTSRDAFSYSISDDGSAGFTIHNDCDYAEYIVEPGSHNVENGGTPIVDIIIPQYVSRSNPTVVDMLQALRDAVDDTERRLATVPAPARKTRGRR